MCFLNFYGCSAFESDDSTAKDHVVDLSDDTEVKDDSRADMDPVVDLSHDTEEVRVRDCSTVTVDSILL